MKTTLRTGHDVIEDVHAEDTKDESMNSWSVGHFHVLYDVSLEDKGNRLGPLSIELRSFLAHIEYIDEDGSTIETLIIDQDVKGWVMKIDDNPPSVISMIGAEFLIKVTGVLIDVRDKTVTLTF